MSSMKRLHSWAVLTYALGDGTLLSIPWWTNLRANKSGLARITVILESQTFIPSTNLLKTCMIERRYPEFHGKWDKHICAEYIHELNCAGMTLACTSSGNQLGTFVGISSNGGIIFLGSRITRGQCLSSSHLQNISHKSSLRKV